jgi:glycosyltransferase involved in cell wall biosynthesis
MKVLHVYRTYFPDPPGGGQEAIRQISIATGNCGVENRIFTLSPNPFPIEIERPEARVSRCRSWAAPASCDLGSLDALKNFAQLANWSDVIHYHFPWPFADVLELMVRPNKPKVMTYHSDIVRQLLLKKFYDPLMRHMLDSMDTIVATSIAYATTSPVLADPRHAERVRVIPLGIEESSCPASADKDILAEIGVKPDEPYFLFVGVLRYYKGLKFFVEAARHVEARIVIAGAGPEESSLKARVTELGLRNVIFAGQVTEEQKVALLERCRALVLPSHLRSEAFGVVLIEASMYRRPMISCEVGSGTSFVNAHGETGLVVPPEDIDALAGAMNALLADGALVEKFGIAARQRYESFFSGPALGKAYAQLYHDVIRN